MELNVEDILTRVTRYNLIRNSRMIYIDVHKKVQGNLAGDYIAVPNLVNIIAESRYQGAGGTEEEALSDCLRKIKGLGLADLFPKVDSKNKAPEPAAKF
ncbi:MAG: hypothetical protein CSA25_00490 [Desulfobacter postgatei]|uniref:Uncharacterized protein n=1 Tax=Desulfobacter postgatei TaxID=2293 RepID=A0A2G6MTX1_9BACT|nr:MAG: hypothetical protein CSA25_00490 [Desulfobacter postgatei]